MPQQRFTDPQFKQIGQFFLNHPELLLPEALIAFAKEPDGFAIEEKYVRGLTSTQNQMFRRVCGEDAALTIRRQWKEEERRRKKGSVLDAREATAEFRGTILELGLPDRAVKLAIHLQSGFIPPAERRHDRAT